MGSLYFGGLWVGGVWKESWKGWIEGRSGCESRVAF